MVKFPFEVEFHRQYISDMPPRTSKRVKQPATPISGRVEKSQQSKTQKKNKSVIEHEVQASGQSIKGGLTAFKTSPSAQSVSSANNRHKVLDLDTSYVGRVRLPKKAPKPPRHRRWKHKGKQSLEDPTQLPDDWTDSEPDLSDEYVVP